MTGCWTLIGQPPGNTPLIDGPAIPDGVEITVVPVQADGGAATATQAGAEREGRNPKGRGGKQR